MRQTKRIKPGLFVFIKKQYRLIVLTLLALAFVTFYISWTQYRKAIIASLPVTVPDTPTPTPVPTLSPTPTPLPGKPSLHEEQHWLSNEQFDAYTSQIGISLVPPQSLGDPYLAVDWNSDPTAKNVTSKADHGRMVALGFANTFSGGSRWGGVDIIYSTYDFTIGSEYEVYVLKSDYQKLKKGLYTAGITVNGIKGFTNYIWMSFFEKIEKVVAFPFPDHYIVVATYLQGDYKDNHDAIIKQLYAGEYPESEKAWIKFSDDLVQSLHFTQSQEL